MAAYEIGVDSIKDWGKLVAATSALLTEQDVTTATFTATTAVDNNFAVLAYYGVVAAGVAYSAYDIYNVYHSQGAAAALKQLGIDELFSEWDIIFSNHAMTVAAIDRLVHYATILEIITDSYRKK